MGSSVSTRSTFLVTVKTGDGLDAGTNSSVHIVFEDHKGKSTKQFPISDPSRGHLKRGETKEYRVPKPYRFGNIAKLKIALGNKDGIHDDWYCANVFVKDLQGRDTFDFQVHHRIELDDVYEFNNDATHLPQHGPSKTTKEEYQFNYMLTAAMVKDLPRDETFSFEYAADFIMKFGRSEAEQLPCHIRCTNNDNIEDIYCDYFPLPESFQFWREDAWFGAQRLQGLLPNIIELCTEIPDKQAITALIGPGGKLGLFSIGTEGATKLNAKAVPLFTFNRAIGSVESDARARGVWDKQVLPYYPFRDDAASIYTITKKYVTTTLKNFYETSEDVLDDMYLQAFHAELIRSRKDNGVGIPDLPGSYNTGFSTVDEVIDMVTIIIMQCSVGHAAVNFPQYESYGYMPNYPANINGPPPRQKVDYTEEDIMGLLPDKTVYLGIMGITKLLSWDGTNELGNYVKEYFNDRKSREALKEYRKDLKEFSIEVMKRNGKRIFPYKYLDPEYIPNAISI